MKRIKLLSKNLINQIAAGEVIERPANVVKELVENSIDAGASKIEITISNDCRNIRVADNGSGIHPDDIELAFSNHATSKLTDETGLFNIETLGFRGEALSSMISIAKVACTTRTKDFEYGTRAQAENSTVSFSQTGCALGTIMEVNDLFFNQPARLKFLKNQRTEFAYIQEYVQALAISRPKIGFVLKNNNSTVINTTPNCDLMSRILQIYPPELMNELREVNKQDTESGINITGYISVPSYTRSSKKSIYVFVNSRMVKCPVILKAIDTAYKNMLPNGRYPFAVLNLNINPSEIDVNVHPAKKEIRYKNTNQIFNFVQNAIDYALSSHRVDFSAFEHKEEKTNYIPFIKEKNNSFDDDEEEPKPFNISTIRSDNFMSEIKQKSMELNFDTPAEDTHINIIGQYAKTYILVENEDNLEIIDQHIAEERYIYEQLKSQKEIASQILIVSDLLDIEPSDAALLANAHDQLEKYGYSIERVSDNQVLFKKIPQVLSGTKPADILSELIINLKDSLDNKLDTIEERILITTSCKAAVKAGDKLNLWQMEGIVKRLRTTKNPYTCPHGRPISHYIPLKEVASYFARNVITTPND